MAVASANRHDRLALETVREGVTSTENKGVRSLFTRPGGAAVRPVCRLPERPDRHQVGDPRAPHPRGETGRTAPQVANARNPQRHLLAAWRLGRRGWRAGRSAARVWVAETSGVVVASHRDGATFVPPTSNMSCPPSMSSTRPSGRAARTGAARLESITPASRQRWLTGS